MPDNIMEVLRENGLDISIAMEICAGDEDIYIEVLETALEEGGRKLPLLKKCLEENNFERYLIEVHALKNAMRTIGAMELSDQSLALEKAIREGQYDVVRTNNDKFLSQYTKLMDMLSELL